MLAAGCYSFFITDENLGEKLKQISRHKILQMHTMTIRGKGTFKNPCVQKWESTLLGLTLLSNSSYITNSSMGYRLLIIQCWSRCAVIFVMEWNTLLQSDLFIEI